MTPEEALDHILKLKALAIADEETDFATACEIAVEALGKTLPQRPSLETPYYYCPVCRGGITSKEGLCGNGWNLFCNHCGQALKWENDDGN